jgi:hypothetical protein
MPYPRHYLLSFGGNFVSDPGEIWANNIRFAPDDNLDGAVFVPPGSDTDSRQMLEDVSLSVQQMVQSSNCGYSSNTRLQYVKLNEIGTDGHYASTTESYTNFLTSNVVGGGTSDLPIHVALCVTWLTGAARGPGSRGRIYVPQPAAGGLSAGGRITNSRLTAIAGAWKDILSAVELNPDANGPGIPSPHKPSVVSDRGTNGVARTITRVRVGDVLDVMNSRRNRLTEARVTSASFN